MHGLPPAEFREGLSDMAKSARLSKSGKARPETRPITFRATDAYAEWLAKAAAHDRSTVAMFLDRAAIDRAKAIGFNEPPPPRTP
jgi:hypothetical protein